MRRNKLSEFGLYVKTNLVKLGLTQRQLSNETGVPEKYLSKMLYGLRSGKKYKKRIIDFIKKKKANKMKIA